MKKGPDKVICPLVERKIESIDCIETADAVDGMIRVEQVPSEYQEKKDWMEICRQCKWHGY